MVLRLAPFCGLSWCAPHFGQRASACGCCRDCCTFLACLGRYGWDLYLNTLDLMFRACLIGLSDEGLISVQDYKVRNKTGIKSEIPKWSTTTWSRTKNTWGKGSMGIVKARKSLARIFELRRLLLRPDHERDAQAVVSLCRKLGMDWEPGLIGRLHREIATAQASLRKKESDIRKHRLETWKNEISSNPRFLGSWLKSRSSPPQSPPQRSC